MRYLSDEFAIVDREASRIQPFPRAATRKADGPSPPGERVGFLDDWGFRDYVLPDLRCDVSPRPLRPRWILFPRHAPDATPRAERLDARETSARFMTQVFDFEGAEAERWPALANLVSGARACAFDFREAAADLDLALDVLADDSA